MPQKRSQVCLPLSLASAGESSAVEELLAARIASVQSLYLSLLSGEFLSQARERENNHVYNTPVVMLLMILQRLRPEGSLESAMLKLLGLPASLWLQPGARTMSTNTDAYNNARQKLPLQAVEEFADNAFAQMTACANGSSPTIGRRAFVFDGTTVQTPHTKALRQLYPPTSNQEGKSHGPLIRMLVAHDVTTGLGMRPEWGAVNGPHAVSEQRLFEQAVQRLPEQAVVVTDANFGVFSAAFAATRQNHPVVARMTAALAKSLLKGPLLDGIDKRIDWKPTKADCKTNPALPLEACVSGRLIVSHVQPNDGGASFLLCLFTTLEEDVEEILKIYGLRWNVETDIGSLKGTLRLDPLTCKTPEMLDNEIQIAMLSYNLVRAVIYQAAQQAGAAPRTFSFTRVNRILKFYGAKIEAATTVEETERLIALMNHYIGQAKLYPRKKKRPA